MIALPVKITTAELKKMYDSIVKYEKDNPGSTHNFSSIESYQDWMLNSLSKVAQGGVILIDENNTVIKAVDYDNREGIFEL